MSYQPKQPYGPPPQYQQMPTPPPPEPPKNEFMQLWLSLWHNHRTVASILVIAATIFVSSAVIAGVVQGIQQSLPQAQSVATATSAPIPTDTPIPTVAATTAPAITHGTPHVGGLLSDFMGKYGTPNNQGVGNSQTWFLSSGTILLNARPDTNGKVSYISVSGPTAWTDAQSFAECAAYLPIGASKFNAVGALTDYHSSVGEIVLRNAGSGVCTISIAGS